MSATEHHVHGTDGKAAPADWPALTTGEISKLLQAYPHVGTPRDIAWHSPRPLSAAALVQTSRGRVFVKRHHCSVRSRATLGEEHRFIAWLRAHGAAIPELLSDRTGATAVARGDWTFEVHARAAGIDLYRDVASWQPLRQLGHARQAGRALARLHQAAAGYSAPQRNTHILVTRDDLLRATDPIATLQTQLPRRPGLARFLEQRDWQTAFDEHILPRQQQLRERVAAQPRLWTHNDWHASNLAWTSHGEDAGVRMAFDFGLASPAFALFDLATAIERNAIAWLELPHGPDIAHIDTARALVHGYCDVTPLSAADLQLLAELLAVVHIGFALSELEYFLTITRSRHDADIAWHTFLLGHARWFDSRPGRMLQDAIAGTCTA